MKRSNKSIVESLRLNGWKAWEENGIVKIQYTKDVAPYMNKEETMNPEKEAQECSEEKWKQEVREIVREEIGNIFKPKGAQSVEINKVPEPQPQLTQKENNILKGLYYLGWSWIARDEDGDLYVFKTKPYRVPGIYNYWQNTSPECEHADDFIVKFNDLFQFIQWQDKEPPLIANLIDWGDEA